jgi:succinate-acetate transporter protein
VAPATRVVLRPIASSLPLGFLALTLATVVFSAVQLGWVPTAQRPVAGLVAVAVTAPLQLLASVFGFLARDPVAATGMAVLAGTWAVTGLVTLQSPPGAVSAELGVLLVVAALAVVVPAAAGRSKAAVAAAMATTAVRFGVTGGYELTGSPAWKTAAGVVGLVVALVALYAALALELEATQRREVLPVGRSGLARQAAGGEGVFEEGELAREPGIRPRL